LPIFIGEYIVLVILIAAFVDGCVPDTAQILMETRPDFVNSDSVLLEVFRKDKYADRIFAENYELYVYYERNYDHSAQDQDIMQVRERINSIPGSN
jgi:hypothetical protein